MGEHSDDFVVLEGSLWKSVMSVECVIECLRVEHDLFCTNQPSVIGVCWVIGLPSCADILFLNEMNEMMR